MNIPKLKHTEIFLKDTIGSKSYVDFRHSPTFMEIGMHRDFRDRDKASALINKISLPKFGNTRYKINKLKQNPILNRKKNLREKEIVHTSQFYYEVGQITKDEH